MIPKSELIFVYEGYWGDKKFAFGSTEEDALKALERCYAYGEPEEDLEDRLGTHWAIGDESEGWRIVPREVKVQHIDGTVYGSFPNNLPVHLYWDCPSCGYNWGDDVLADTKFPHLVLCKHRKNSGLETSYFLVHISEEDRVKLNGT